MTSRERADVGVIGQQVAGHAEAVKARDSGARAWAGFVVS
jgi:hypothetical protein